MCVQDICVIVCVQDICVRVCTGHMCWSVCVGVCVQDICVGVCVQDICVRVCVFECVYRTYVLACVYRTYVQLECVCYSVTLHSLRCLPPQQVVHHIRVRIQQTHQNLILQVRWYLNPHNTNTTRTRSSNVNIQSIICT